jgi:hypothetical protein
VALLGEASQGLPTLRFLDEVDRIAQVLAQR